MSLSIHGLPPGYGSGLTESDAPTSREARAGRQAGAGTNAGETAREAARVGSGPEAPIDARLWDLLSGDERAFYLRHAANGPLTYAPSPSSHATNPGSRQLGGRIDLRV